MDGYEVSRRLRAAGFSAPILALTANAFAEEQLRCREAGMDAVLAKPIGLPQLRSALLDRPASRPA